MDKQYVVYRRVLFNSKKGRNWYRPHMDEPEDMMPSSVWKWMVGLHSNVNVLKVTEFSSVRSLSHIRLFATPCTAAHQASLSITNSWSLLKLMFIESVIPSNHLILCRPLFPLPSIFPSIRVFSNESVLHIRWPKYWSFSWTVHLKMLKIVNPMLCIFYHN